MTVANIFIAVYAPYLQYRKKVCTAPLNRSPCHGALGQVHQKGKSPSKLATTLTATKQKRQKTEKKKNNTTNIRINLSVLYNG